VLQGGWCALALLSLLLLPPLRQRHLRAADVSRFPRILLQVPRSCLLCTSLLLPRLVCILLRLPGILHSLLMLKELLRILLLVPPWLTRLS